MTATKPLRLPPHSVDAERCALASMMLDAQVCQHVMCTAPRDAFYLQDHQEVYDAIKRLHDAGKPVDAVLVREELLRSRRLDGIGGTAALADIITSVPDASHGVYYAGIVRERWVRRQLIQLGTELAAKAYESGGEEDEAVKLASSMAARLAAVAAGGSGEQFRLLFNVVEEVLEGIVKGSASERFIPSGFADLDANIIGFRRGGYTLVGGRPGMGKSQFLKSVGLNAARAGYTVCHITIEEQSQKVAGNLLSTMSGVANHRIMAGVPLHEHEWRMIDEALKDVAEAKYLIDESPHTLSQVVAAVMAAKAKYNADMVTIDYLGLIDPGIAGAVSRNEMVMRVSNALKLAFKQTDVAGVVAVQLNRANEVEQVPAEPTLRNLRDSGALEQDGDLILLLHNKDYYYRVRSIDVNYTPTRCLKVVVAKNKNNTVGEVALFQDHETQRLRDWCVATDGEPE